MENMEDIEVLLNESDNILLVLLLRRQFSKEPTILLQPAIASNSLLGIDSARFGEGHRLLCHNRPWRWINTTANAHYCPRLTEISRDR